MEETSCSKNQFTTTFVILPGNRFTVDTTDLLDVSFLSGVLASSCANSLYVSRHDVVTRRLPCSIGLQGMRDSPAIAYAPYWPSCVVDRVTLSIVVLELLPRHDSPL